MQRAIGWWNAHQVALYLAAIAVGAAVGLLAAAAAPALELAITPALALLLFATFLGVPLLGLVRGLRDICFLATLLVVDFVAVPALVAGLSRAVADDRALLIGALLVLLTPCVDYVVVFTGIAGGDRTRLLAATPLLMLVQLLLLPVFIALIAGPDAAAAIDPAPFVETLVVVILIPLAAAVTVQALARRSRTATVIDSAFTGAMVPLMMLVLAVVVGSQLPAVGGDVGALARLVPLYLGFLIVMTAIGLVAGRIARLDVPGTRAIIFSGTTRNSLVVLPLALALPAGFELAPLAVVTQTLVELLGLVALVALVPRLARVSPEPSLTKAPS